MRTVELNHQELRAIARFTDPFLHSYEKEHEILSYHRAGELLPPSLVEYSGQLLIFNGNHRVLVAIAHKLTIICTILENLEDVRQVQAAEGDRHRDLSAVVPLTFEGIVQELVIAAARHSNQDPDDYSFADF